MKRFIFLPLLLLLGLAQPAHAQFSRIISIRLVNGDNTLAQSFQSNFSIKVGAACTWSVTGTVATINCGGGATIGGSIAATQVAFGSGANTIAGSNSFVWSAGTLGITVVDGDTPAIQLLNPADMMGELVNITPTGSGRLTVNTYDGTNFDAFIFSSNAAGGQLSIGGDRVEKIVGSGALALATSAVTTGTCTAAQTAAATGTLTTDTIEATFNADPTGVTGYLPATTGGFTIFAYPTADTFNIKVCNRTASDITPGAVTINWKVTR